MERKSLIEMESGVQSQLENSLLGIWSEVLRSSSTQRVDAGAAFGPLGVSDDIFARGADSIQLVQVVRRIQRELHYNVTVGTVIDHPTVAGLARAVMEGIPSAEG